VKHFIRLMAPHTFKTPTLRPLAAVVNATDPIY
jgi:hypothetical protein